MGFVNGGIVGGYYGVSSGGLSFRDSEGTFTATTVVQRAFEQGDLILYDNGTNLTVYLASQDIPIGSPVPGSRNALWGVLPAQITSGISNADLTARLRNYVQTSALSTALRAKADIDALNDYLRTAAYNLDKARLESGITGNDNDISALMSALTTLQTQVNNLPTGGGGGGGDVTTAALNTAIENLRTALQAKIDAKEDADTAATDAELTSAISDLRTALQANIDALSTRVGNIPVNAVVLWGTSKQLGTRLARGTVDTDWTIADNVPTGVAVDGDMIDIPEGFRGDLHVDIETTTGDLIQRKIIPIHIGNVNFSTPLSNRLRTRIIQDPTDATKLNFLLEASQAVTMPSASIVKIYGVTALPRSLVAAVTQAEFDALKAEVDTKLNAEDFYIDPDKRYATPAQLSDNWVLYFSHVPTKYQSANLVRVNWDGIPVYAGSWTPSTEYIIFGIDPTQIDNLRTNVTRDGSKPDWLVEVRFFDRSTQLGFESLRILIDRG